MRRSVLLFFYLSVAGFTAVACSDDAGVSDADTGGDSGVDLGADADVGVDGLDVGDLIGGGLGLTAERGSLDVSEVLDLTATVWTEDGPVAERTPVRFEVADGAGWFDADGLTSSLQPTTSGRATTRFRPEVPGAVTVRATAGLGDGRTLTGTIALEVTGALSDPVVDLVDVDDVVVDGEHLAGGGALRLQAVVTGPQGRAAEAVTLAVTTTAGEVASSSGGPWSLSTSVRTDSGGQADIWFDPRTFRGPVAIEARVSEAAFATGATARYSFTVVQAAELDVATLDPPTLGVVDSGLPEQGDVVVELRDRSGDPLADTNIALGIAGAIDATVSPASVTTDEVGRATATVSAGARAGPFRVRAEATVDGLLIESLGDRHDVVTGRPATRYSAMSCTPANAGGLVGLSSEQAPDVTVRCEGTLRDRRQAPIGVQRTVFLEAEVGQVPASVTSDEEGHFAFDWTIDAWPAPVSPFRGSPRPEEIEPQFDVDDDGESNPRDLIARVIFYAEGEELFTDDDDNGIRGAGEGFFERSEPFVDVDDDGWRDPEEPFVDAPWGDAEAWDDNNGEWNAQTLVWGAAIVTLSGAPSTAETGAGSDRDTYSQWLADEPITPGGRLSVGDNTRADIELLLADPFGAPPSGATTVSFALDGCGAAAELASDAVVPVGDHLGIDAVTIQSPIDVGWRLLDTIIGFDGGIEIDVSVRNPPRGDSADCRLIATVDYGACATCEADQQLTVELWLTIE